MHKDLPDLRTPSRTPVHGLRRLVLAAAFVAGGLASHAALAATLDDALSAASMGDAKELVSLIQRGLDPDTVDAQGNTLLILAAREGH
ncbi:MAG TPA: ankyrin repeat domain-containing protein, partial [Thauera aminoaromatica]|nr:ankyrin repeat domain-containing protein [Thauera aminoaromatica]